MRSGGDTAVVAELVVLQHQVQQMAARLDQLAAQVQRAAERIEQLRQRGQ
jgi:cell division protein FtsB